MEATELRTLVEVEDRHWWYAERRSLLAKELRRLPVPGRALDIGAVRIKPAGGGPDVLAAVHGGFVEVSNDRVTILSDVAELADQIDVERARRAEERARRVDEDRNDAEAEAALRRATTRLQVAGA